MAGLALDAWAARVPPPRPSSAKAQGQDVDGDPVDHGEPPAIAVNGEQVATAPPSVAPVASTESATVPSGPAAGVWRPGTTPSPPRPLERLAAAAVTGALFGAAAAKFGAVPELAAYCVLFGGLVALSVADIRVGLVPRKIVYPTLALLAVALLAAAGVAGDWRPLGNAAIGGAAGFLVFFAIWWISPRAMGFGDVRLAGLVGAALGWLGFRQLYLGFLAAFVVGSVVGLVKMAVRGTGRKTALPFGPALAVGAVVGVLWGGYLANLWFHPGG